MDERLSTDRCQLTSSLTTSVSKLVLIVDIGRRDRPQNPSDPRVLDVQHIAIHHHCDDRFGRILLGRHGWPNHRIKFRCVVA